MEMLKRAAGIDIQAIPYRGDAPLNTALIAGEVSIAAIGMARMSMPAARLSISIVRCSELPTPVMP